MPNRRPNPDSRLTLGDRRDSLRMRRLKTDWRTTDPDYRSLKGGLCPCRLTN